MSALVAQIGAQRTASFRTEAEGARQDMERFKGSVAQVGAELTSMQRAARAAGGGTVEQTTRIKELRRELDGLKADLRTASTEYKTLSAITPPPMPRAAGPSSARADVQVQEAVSGHGGHGTGNKAQLAHSGRATLEMIMAGQSPLQAAQVEIPRVIQAFGGGLGTMLGVGAAVAAVNKVAEGIGESIAKARELGNELRDALRPGPSQGRSSIEAEKKRIEELGTAIDDAKPKLGMLRRGWQAVSDKVGNVADRFNRNFLGSAAALVSPNAESLGLKDETATSRNDKLRHEAIEERKKIQSDVNAQLTEENDLRERALNFGEGSVKQDELRAKKAHELAALEDELGISRLNAEKAKVQADPSISEYSKRARIGQIDEELEPKRSALVEQSAEIERKYATLAGHAEREEATRRIERELKRDLNSAREGRSDMSVEGAALRALSADKKVEIGAPLGPEHDNNREEARAARMDLEDAQNQDKTRAASVSAEESILQIKREGFEVEKRVAQQRVEAAQAALANSRVREGAEYKALELAVHAAQEEVRLAEKVTSEKLAAAHIDERVAGLRGSSAQVRRQTLGIERRELERQSQLPENALDKEKSAEFAARLARNAQQRSEFEKAERLRTIDTRDLDARAHTGRGPAQAMKLIDQELGFIQDRLKWNKAENGGDEHFAKEQNLAAKQLRDTKAEIVQHEKESLATIKQTTTAIGQQGFTLTLAQKQQGIRQHYGQQIEQARFNGDSPETIAAMERQRVAALENASIDEELMTPGEKARRRRDNTRREQARDRVRSRNGTGTTKAHEASGNRHSPSFDDLVNAGRPVVGLGRLPAQRPDPHAATPKSVDRGRPVTLAPEAMTVLREIRDKVDFKMR